MHVCQAEIAALIAICQLGVIKAQQVQNRRVQIVNVNGVFRDVEAQVIGFAHGGAWYERAGASVEPAPFLPVSWRTYAGYFRSHNPWCPAFRIVPRRGRLWLIFPVAPDGFEDEQPLAPIEPPGAFRAGTDPDGPETVVFDAVVDGRALRATLSGGAYWRVEAP